MDLVLLKCAQCNAKIGNLANLWTQIGKRYVTQAIRSQDSKHRLKVKPSGSVRFGDVDTLIAGCELREAECEQCHTNLGQTCIKTPPNHVLHDGQIIFRTASINVRSGSDYRRTAELKIQNALKLRESPAAQPAPQGVAGAQGQGLDILQIQNDLEVQKREIQRIGSTGFQVMTTFETTIARFEQQMKRINDSLDAVRDDEESCRKDLSSLKAKVTELQWQPLPHPGSHGSNNSNSNSNNLNIVRLETQLQATESSMGELQQGYQRAKSEAAKLRHELSQTQHQLQQLRAENAALKSGVQDAQDVARECISTSKLYAAEMSGLRGEIQQLKTDLACGTLQQPSSNEDSLVQAYTHELDVLATNVSRIGHRTSQIETLQMEFQLFRARVQRLEARSATCTPARGEAAAAAAVVQEPSAGAPRWSNGTRHKRPSMSGEDPLSYDPTPSKRVAVASSQTLGLSFDDGSVGDELPSSPPVVRARSPIQASRNASRDGARARRFMNKR